MTMTKEDIQNRIEQVAYDGATDGYNQAVIEREAEKLATELIKLFAIPDAVERSEQCDHDYCDGTGTGWNVCKKCGDMY